MTTPEITASETGGVLKKAVRNWRIIAFTFFTGLFAVASFVVLEGFTEGLMPWHTIGCPGCMEGIGYDPATMRWHGAEHGATVGLLFGGSLVLLLWKAVEKPLLLQFYALGHLALAAGYGLLPVPGEPFSLSGFAFITAIMVVPAAVLISLYPNRRELLRLRSGEGFSVPMLALTAVSSVFLLPVAWVNIGRQLEGALGAHAVAGRWGGAAIIVACLIIAGLLASTKRPGWKALGGLLGVTFLYLGAAAITVPSQPGSWGVLGGVLALAAGAGYLAVVLREGRKPPDAKASTG